MAAWPDSPFAYVPPGSICEFKGFEFVERVDHYLQKLIGAVVSHVYLRIADYVNQDDYMNQDYSQ